MERAELARLLGVTAPGGGVRATAPRVITAEATGEFMAEFAQAVGGGGAVFLADPAWGEPQRALLANLMATEAVQREHGWLMIPSGGTSGGSKFARHDQATLAAAVGGFCAHFDLARVNAVGLLPLHHVSGLMAWMRCALTGGVYLPWSWTELKGGLRPELAAGATWVISLVPTQLQRLLESVDAAAWLRRFSVIFVGGGPVWPALADAAERAALPIALSYGMTETAAMVTALQPADFLSGARSSGTALPHASVTITAEGVVEVAGESLFRGYFPEWREAREFQTEDLGRIDAHGHLHVVGRRDAMIITGGKKVQPAEVEAALRATRLFADVAVGGVPDAEWGEAVVAFYPADGTVDESKIIEAVEKSILLSHQRPKRYVAVAARDWPRNAQGKLNRVTLRALVTASG